MEREKITLRLPPELMEKLREQAQEMGMSMDDMATIHMECGMSEMRSGSTEIDGDDILKYGIFDGYEKRECPMYEKYIKAWVVPHDKLIAYNSETHEGADTVKLTSNPRFNSSILR